MNIEAINAFVSGRTCQGTLPSQRELLRLSSQFNRMGEREVVVDPMLVAAAQQNVGLYKGRNTLPQHMMEELGVGGED